MSGSEVMGDYIFTRFRVRLTVPNFHLHRGDKAAFKAECLRDTIQQFLDEGAKVDSTFALAPWSVKAKDLDLRLPNSKVPLPTHLDQAKLYYHSLNYYSTQSDMIFYLRLRHEISYKAVLNNVIRPVHLSLYVASLQSSEDPIKGGFFVYSHRAFATSSSLTEAITLAFSTAAGKSIEVALYWGPINLARVEGPTFYALQIEVDSCNYDVLKRTMTNLYYQSKIFPLGVPMVYVPPVAKCINTQLLIDACGSQTRFNQLVMVMDFRCFLQTNLDTNLVVKEFPITMHPDKGKLSTLRGLFKFGARLEEKPVFHSVLQCVDMQGEP